MPESVGELPVNTGATATQMANEIFGAGVTVNSAFYYGDADSSGTYSNGDTVSPTLTPGDTGIILSTGDAQDITNSSGQTNQNTGTSTDTSGFDGWGPLNNAAGSSTFDGSALLVNFTPDAGADTMTMQFVFASEEYPEFTNSQYQDLVYVQINGVEVPLTVGDGDIDPGNINSADNQNLFLDNTTDEYNTEMDGFTVTMTLKIPVNAGVNNQLIIAIADVADTSYDSNLLIAGGSLQTSLLAVDDTTSLEGGQTKTIDVLGNDEGSGTLTITHIDGQAVIAGQTVDLPTGQTVTLNADGTLTMVAEPVGEDFNYTYTIDNGTNTDTAFVEVSAVPCFVAGTLIRTPHGDVAVEDLRPGDLVETADDGPQPLRWVGQRRVAAEGNLAPIEIAANTFGQHTRLLVSPLHRVLVRDALAEILFGESEVLVAARDLVNDKSVTRRTGGTVDYHHLLFDRHQIVFSEGLATESFLPGPQINSSFEAEVVDEICTIFPELDPDTGGGYGAAARRTLRKFEAQILRRPERAA